MLLENNTMFLEESMILLEDNTMLLEESMMFLEDGLMENSLLWYWFVNIYGVGLKTRHQLLDVFGHPGVIWDLPESEIGAYLTQKQYHSFKKSKDRKRIQSSYDRLLRQGIRFLSVEDDDYPQRLKYIPLFPHGLYLKGRLPEPSYPLLAVVGSRTPTSYGKSVASYFVKKLSRAGIGIVSGLACGIDTIAHHNALYNDQYTLGVLGGGIDSIYPKDNFNLYYEMYERGGVLSEYNLGIPNLPGYFPVRNRIISGISAGTLVVEAGERSGSLITADLALEQGKEVYAVPGRVTDPLSRGCNGIIAEGARLILDPGEIIEDFITQYHLQRSTQEKDHKSQPDFENDLERQIYSLLDVSVPKSPNEIKQYVETDFSQLLRILLNMEMKQLVRQEGHQWFVKIL